METAIWLDQLNARERAELVRGAGVIPEPRPDLLIVGGGIAGVATAAACHQAGLGSVLLVEAGHLGAGATGGAAGLLTPEIHEWSDPEPFVDLARASLGQWAELEETSPGGVGLVDVDWIGLSPDPGALAPHQSPAVEWLEPDYVARLIPGLSMPDGGRADSPPGPGQPAALAGPAVRRAARGGHRGRRDRRHGPGRPDRERGHDRGPGAAGRGGLRHRAARRCWTAWTSTCPGNGSKAICSSPSRRRCGCPASWRRSPPSWRTGGCSSAGRSTWATRARWSGRRSSTASSPACTPRCPQLQGLRADYTWCCFRPRHPDGLPVIDRIHGLGNAWLTSGHYRTGILLAPVTAQALVRWISSDQPPAEAPAWSSERFAGRGLSGR